MDDRDLIERWVAGEADEADAVALRARLAAEPKLMRALFEAAERECELHDLFASLATTATDGAPRATSAWARRRREPLWRWLVPLAAAAALVAVALLGVSQLRQSAAEAHALETPMASQHAAPPSSPPTAIATNPAAHPATATAPTDATPRAPEVDAQIAEVKPADHPSSSSTGPAPLIALEVPRQPSVTAQESVVRHAATVQVDRRDGELKDDAGALLMRYTLRAPRQLDAQARPGLVLCFHGAGGDERWLADPMVDALRAQGVMGEFVVASLKSKGKDWAADDDARVLGFIDWAQKAYHADPRRLIIQGVSNGGWFVDFFASHHQDLVAGVVTVSSGWGFDLKKHANAAETAPEFYLVHGIEDKDVNVRSSRASVANLRSLGYRFVYREYAGYAHNVFDDERTRRDFAAWLERLRHKTMPLGDDDRKTLAGFARNDEAERLVQTEAGAGALLRIGGVPAERVLVRCLRARAAPARAAAATLLARTGCSPGVSTLLAQDLDDRDAMVRRAAASTLAAAADWNDQEALISVCLFAGAKARERDERLTLIERLIHGLAFRSSPGPDNQLIYELLVHLLDDEDPGLRAAAVEALAHAPAHADPERFGYQADAAPAARRDAVMRWRKWYVELFAPPVDDKEKDREKK